MVASSSPLAHVGVDVGDGADVVVHVPAKVVLLGEHVVQRGAVAHAAAVDLFLSVVARRADVADAGAGDALRVDDAEFAPALRRVLLAAGAACELALRRRGTTYALVVDASRVPRGVGLGSSSALLVGLSAAVLTLAGDGPAPPEAVLALATRVEREWAGASGVDVAACVLGPIRFSIARGASPEPGRFGDDCTLVLTGRAHTASCAHAVTDAQLRAYEALPADLASLPRAHALLDAMGLGFARADAARALVPRAKMTGRGGGGCLLVAPAARADELAALGALADGWRREDGAPGARVLPRVRLLAPDETLRVHDARFRRVPRELLAPRVALRVGDRAAAVAPSNIALVKYWGKRELQMACNASISLTLPHCSTRTTLEVTEDASREARDPRVAAFVRRVAGAALPSGCVVGFETRSNFPPACGIASSASGFAALALALAELLGVGAADDGAARRRAWVEHWARLGSGSAVRSAPAAVVVDPDAPTEASHAAAAAAPAQLVSWVGARAVVHAVDADADAVAVADADADASPPSLVALEHALVVFSPFPKRVGSSEGHARAPTSPFFELRAAMADEHVAAVARAFAGHDDAFDLVRRVSEQEAVTMHMTMHTSAPPVRYLTPEALAFVARFVRYRDAHRLRALFTIDAGENVHLLFDARARDAVLGFARGAHAGWPCVLHRGVRTSWFRAVAVSGKRFAGKTTLCDAWAAEPGARDRAQFVSLSTAIKRAYWEQRVAGRAGEPGWDEFARPRGAHKERHRAAMVEFAEAAIAAHGPHVWLRAMWASLAPHPRVVVVSDVRRERDLGFIRACADCVAVRVECDDEARVARGWERDPAVDASESEVGLDGAAFAVRVRTDGDAAAAAPTLDAVLARSPSQRHAEEEVDQEEADEA